MLAAWGIIAWQTVGLLTNAGQSDALGYWITPISDPYRVPWGGFPAFPYSPAAVLAPLWPIQHIPLAVWLAWWMALNVGIVVWLIGPLAAAVLMLGPTVGDSWNPLLSGLWWGNIPFLMVAAVVLLRRVPAVGAFLVLTKVTPGVTLAWFAVRRQWREFAIAVGTTLGIAAISFAIVPNLWTQWLALMVSQPSPDLALAPPLLLGPASVRAVLALGLWPSARGRTDPGRSRLRSGSPSPRSGPRALS
jgi:hypothetical protein